ncbi:hypothetical protein [Bacillus badius]|uniref:Transposase n=1 Tax=Bacillus badius TaxID=1455 RepID=A0ABR5AR02_BACBA|nr:hypothetical protein [Bacillus badius]KIL75833.1 Transposase [Bacillus badius]
MVSDWLFEDGRLKKKLRRTKKQLFQELKKYDFPGSYRTVCQFIQEWEAQQEETKDKGYERLTHSAGEAQVDFGIMETVHPLVMSFPFSNTAFAVPMPSENQECFLAGLQLLFDQCGGVPLSIRIDNLTPAVKRPRDKQMKLYGQMNFWPFKAITDLKCRYVIQEVVMRKAM